MKFLYSIIGTMKADVIILFRYRKSIISDIITFLALYLGIIIFNDASNFSDFYNVQISDGPILLLIGYIFWTVSNIALSYSSSIIVGDAKSGMLEVKLQGIIPYPVLSFFSVLVSIIESIIVLFFACLISLVIGYIEFTHIPFILLSIVLTIPSIIGMYGVGLILAGFALKEKSIGQFVSIVSAILLFLSNTLILNLPNYIYIIPFTSGIDISRNLFSTGVFDSYLFIIYICVCLLWLVVGILIFNILLKKERTQGSFDSF